VEHKASAKTHSPRVDAGDGSHKEDTDGPWLSSRYVHTLQATFVSLRFRLMLLGFLAVVPSFALLFSLNLNERARIYATAEQDGLQLARYAATDQQRHIDDARHLLMIIAQLPQAQSTDIDGCNVFFAELLGHNPEYTNMGVIRPDGSIICSAVPLTESVNVADRAYFRRAMEVGGFVLGEYQVGRVSGQPSLPVAYPVFGDDGAVRGVVYAAIDLQWLTRLATEIRVPPGTIISLMDSEGTILSRYPDPERYIGKSTRNVQVIREAFARGEGTTITDGSDGVERTYVVTALPSGDPSQRIYLTAGIPLAPALAAGTTRFLVGLLLLGIVAAAGVTILWIGSDAFILRQVRALLQATQQLSTGDLSARTGLTGGQGELGELARSFDAMTASLQRNEERLRQSEKMEAIGRLAGGIAHDFNNLLTAIIGFGDLLQERIGDAEPDRTFVREIIYAGQRAAQLTSQLLIFSRRQVSKAEAVNLNDVVQEMGNLLKRVIGEDITLATVLGPQLGQVRGDPTQFSQIVLNLAANARDAMPTGGQLTIETASVDLDEAYARQHPGTRPGPHVMLAVTDTGVGMDRETQAHIFEPFFTTKEVGKGTGLGLATVFGIVQQAEGSIWVYSEPSHGTSFKIYFPRMDAQAAEPPATIPEPHEQPRATGTILLVEDEGAVRRVARAALNSNGYMVLEAEGAEAALALCASHGAEIDLLLTDLVLPGTDGRVIAEQIVASWPNVRVLYTSGYTDDTVIRHGLLRGEVAFIQKPFTPIALQQKVAETLAIATGDASLKPDATSASAA